MPGIGPDYAQMFSQMAPYLEAQQQGGIDPGYTSAAMNLGYQPNPFAPAGTEGQAQMRFLMTLKNIMDQQMGGPGGRAAQISPGNPIAGMPYGMAQYLGAAGALMQSQQGRALMPGSQAAMFQNGYNWNPMQPSGPNDQSALQQLLISARSGGQGLPGAVGSGGPSALPAGPTQGQPALPPPANQQAPANAAAQANTGATSGQVSGMPGDAASNPAYTTANSDIVRGLMQSSPNRQVASAPGLGTLSVNDNGLLGIIQNLPPERKAQALQILQALANPTQ